MSADGSAFEFGSAPSSKDMAKFPMNNLGDAKRLIRLSGGVIREDGSIDTRSCTLLFQIGAGWVGFNGKYWDRTYGEELARRTAHRVAEVMAPLHKELAEAHELATVSDITKYLRGLGSSGSTTGMLRQAQSYLTVEIDVFDRQPMAINCQNGTLKLSVSGGKLIRTLAAHDPVDRITKIANCDYVDGAVATEFLIVHRTSFPIEDERAAFHRCCGYGATGLTREQSFFVLQGKGNDGKSTLMDCARETLGTYADAADVKTFLEGGQQSAAAASPDLTKLAGDVRFVQLPEPKKGSYWDEARLKLWTSGKTPIAARELQQKSMNFKPVGKLFIECNIFPKPRSDDDGFWRRIKVILFRHQVPRDKVDKDMTDRILANEMPGVLNWLLDGLEDYLCGDGGKGGLRIPKALTDLISKLRLSSSPLQSWLDERFVWGEAADGHWIGSKELIDDLKTYWDEQGHDPNKVPTSRGLGDFLTDRQIMWKKDRKGNKVRGPIRRKTPDELASAAAVEDTVDPDPQPSSRPADGSPAGSGGSEGYEALPPRGPYDAPESGSFDADERPFAPLDGEQPDEDGDAGDGQ